MLKLPQLEASPREKIRRLALRYAFRIENHMRPAPMAAATTIHIQNSIVASGDIVPRDTDR